MCYYGTLTSCVGYPPVVHCINSSDVVFNNGGMPAFVNTFEKCLQNIGGDGPIFAGFAMPDLCPMQLEILISLNNLITVDSLSNAVTLDFLMFVSWNDPRLSMPAFFNAAGIPRLDITSILGQSDIAGNQLQIWFPNLVFLNAITMEIPSNFVRLQSSGVVCLISIDCCNYY